MMQPLQDGDPRIAGEFRLRARLGAGGMGRVYLGYSPAGRAVAVKICHPEFAADPAFVRRFALEVAAARAVNGLFTAQVLDAGPGDDPPWLATAFVPGPSLYDAVTAAGPLPEAAAWRLAAGLAEALRAVHASGLVHRDLKPTNVLLATDGPRVIDFGIARALDGTSLTTTGSTFGTPSYMSPEQASGRPAGPQSDVFAFGGVLVFAATGGTPFGDGEPPAVLYRVVHAPPELSGLPASLRDLAAACLAKDPAARPTLPEILAACARSGEVAPGPAFWPREVAALLARYQAGLDSAAAVDPRDDGFEATRGAAEPGRSPTAPSPAGGYATQAPSRAIGRRRALTGLGGLTAAGLATAGWAVSRSGGGKRPEAHGQPAGRLLWARTTPGPVSSGAAIADGVVYIGGRDGVYAFEAATGRPVSTFRTGGPVQAPVTVAGPGLFACGAGGAVHAWPIAPGGPRWIHQTGGPVLCQPAVAGGSVYVGSDDRYVHALDAGSGQRKWRHLTGGPVRSRPLPGHSPYDGSLYLGSDDGYLYQLDIRDGRPERRFATGGAVDAGVMQDSVAGVYVGNDAGNLYSVLADEPTALWRFSAGGAIRGAPVSAGQTLYIGSADWMVYAVGMEGGEEIWRYRTGGRVTSGLAVAGEVLYAGSDDGYLYAIDVTLGSPRWRYRTGGAIRSQILAVGGVVYFGSLDGRVYALRA